MTSRAIGPMGPRAIASNNPALVRMRGHLYLDEMLDVVDFGVAACGGQETLRSQRLLKYPSRLAIQRSDIKSDGCRKRWNCDKTAAARRPEVWESDASATGPSTIRDHSQDGLEAVKGAAKRRTCQAR